MMSGMIRDEQDSTVERIPCLGLIPVLGTAFSDKLNQNLKRNIIIFIRPTIIDTNIDIENVTRREEKIWRDQNANAEGLIRGLNDIKQILNFPINY